MADVHLRALARQWELTSDPEIGAQYALARMRAGHLVNLAEFPLAVWEIFQTLYQFSEVGHHISLGQTPPTYQHPQGMLLNYRLDLCIDRWLEFIDTLRILTPADFPTFLRHLGTEDANAAQLAEMIVHAASNQPIIKSSIVYYPTLPERYSVIMYLGIALTPETLGPRIIAGRSIPPTRNYLGELRDAFPDEGSHFAWPIRVFFTSRTDPTAPHRFIPAAVNTVTVHSVLNDDHVLGTMEHKIDRFCGLVTAVYDWPEYPEAEGTPANKPVPFLVIRPYS